MSLGVLSIVASALLAGCGILGDDSKTDDSTSRSSRSLAPAPEGTASANPPGAGGGGAQVTAPGSRLAVGQRAVVPFTYGGKTGTIGITVTAIEPGNRSQFEQRFGSRARGLTPYYIRYRIENVGGTDLSNTSAPLLQAVGPDGRGTGVGVIGTLPGWGLSS